MIRKLCIGFAVLLWLGIGAVGIGGFAGQWFVRTYLTRDAAPLGWASRATTPSDASRVCDGLERLSASAIAERLRAMPTFTPELFAAQCINGQPRSPRAQMLLVLSGAARSGDTVAERLIEASARDACATLLALQDPGITITDTLLASCAVVVRPETARFTAAREAKFQRLRLAGDLALIMAEVASGETVARWCAEWPTIDAQTAQLLHAAFPDVDAHYRIHCTPSEGVIEERGYE